MKFTFKTEKSTGRYSAFYPDNHYIKLNKKQVGKISDKKPYLIRLSVVKKDINEDGNPNCKWKWITLKKESKSLQEAKDFLNETIEAIMCAYELHLSD
jgi:hypothetical protein